MHCPVKSQITSYFPSRKNVAPPTTQAKLDNLAGSRHSSLSDSLIICNSLVNDAEKVDRMAEEGKNEAEEQAGRNAKAKQRKEVEEKANNMIEGCRYSFYIGAFYSSPTYCKEHKLLEDHYRNTFRKVKQTVNDMLSSDTLRSFVQGHNVTADSLLGVINAIFKTFATGRKFDDSAYGERFRFLNVLEDPKSNYCCLSAVTFVTLVIYKIILKLMQDEQIQVDRSILALSSLGPCVQSEHQFLHAIVDGKVCYFDFDENDKFSHSPEPEACERLQTGDQVKLQLHYQALVWNDSDILCRKIGDFYESQAGMKSQPLIRWAAMTQNIETAGLNELKSCFEEINSSSIHARCILRDYILLNWQERSTLDPEITRLWALKDPELQINVNDVLFQEELQAALQPPHLEAGTHLFVIGGVLQGDRRKSIEVFKEHDGDFKNESTTLKVQHIVGGISGSAGAVMSRPGGFSLVLVGGKSNPLLSSSKPVVLSKILTLNIQAGLNDRWKTARGQLKVPRSDHGAACVSLPSGDVLAVAGGLCSGSPVSSVEIFINGLDNESMRVSDIPEGGRSYPGVVVVGAELYVVGGENGNNEILSSVSIIFILTSKDSNDWSRFFLYCTVSPFLLLDLKC